jgi:DNA polymerase-3 subunit delta
MTTALGQLEKLDSSMRIVVLHGKEIFLIAEGTRLLAVRLSREYVEPREDDDEAGERVPRVTFDGETAELAEVLDELRTFGLFQDHKLVIVDRADRFLRGGGKAKDEDEAGDDEAGGSKGEGARRRRALEAYAENPSRQSTLLLRAESWHPGKLDKLVAKVGTVIKCEPLNEREAAAWVTANCPQRHGPTISRPAARLLVDRVGVGLARLDGELAKLAAFVGLERPIGRDDVSELVGRSREEQAWELQTAIMAGKPRDACVKMRQLLEISQLDEVLVMWAISDLLRRLHAVAQLLRQGVGAQSLRSPYRLWRATGDRMIEVARHTEPKVFARLLDRAVRTDLDNKSGLGEAGRNLEALTLHVTDTIGSL